MTRRRTQPDWVIKAEEWVPEPRPGGRRGCSCCWPAQCGTRRSSSWARTRIWTADFRLAVERRRRSYSPLLLSPAIGQRACELCEGEIGRRGAVEQCRHDPG